MADKMPRYEDLPVWKDKGREFTVVATEMADSVRGPLVMQVIAQTIVPPFEQPESITFLSEPGVYTVGDRIGVFIARTHVAAPEER